MKKLLLLLLTVLLLVSCATSYREGGVSFLKALGADAEAVVTAKSTLTKNFRVDVSVDAEGRITGVVCLKAVPGFAIERMLSENYEKYVSTEGRKCWFDDSNGLSLTRVGKNYVLFTQKDIDFTYKVLVENPVAYISDEDALVMESASYGIYIPEPSVNGVRKVVLTSEDLSLFDSIFTAEDSRKASSLATVIKAREVEKIRLAGDKPDFEKLGGRFVITDNVVFVKDLDLNDFDLDVSEIVSELSTYLTGDYYGI